MSEHKLIIFPQTSCLQAPPALVAKGAVCLGSRGLDATLRPCLHVSRAPPLTGVAS